VSRLSTKGANTIRAYLAALGVLRAWCESTGTPFELDKPTSPPSRGGCSTPAATANVRHSGLRRFAAFIADEDDTPDPLTDLRPPKQDRKVVPKLSDDELAAPASVTTARHGTAGPVT
jgi:hypothetical protein